MGKSAGIFDPVKLQALNADHIQAATPRTLAPHLIPFIKERGLAASDDAYLYSLIPTLQPRSKTLVEMADQAGFYYTEEIQYDEKPAKKFLKANIREPFNMLTEKLAGLEVWDEKGFEAIFQSVMDHYEIKLGKIAQPVRVALTGTSVSPGIFEIIMILGKERVVSRMKKALNYIRAQAGDG